MSDPALSPRRTAQQGMQPHPRYVVWELTLKCDLACRHCGSRAGRPREEELSLDEAVAIADQLKAMGTQEISFIGGEAYLHPRWLDIVRVCSERGIRCVMTTGARKVVPRLAEAAAEAGIQAMSCSIDGLESTHDKLRAVPGSWRSAVDALGHIQDAGMLAFANTQFNRLNLPEVEELSEVLFAAGIKAWQVQLTGPMGRAADREDWLLQPYQMLDLVPRLRTISERAKRLGISVQAANNLGYFGPHEHILRAAHWQGCKAGQYVLGIESNGDVKGCPSLPSGPYVGGNLRERTLQDIWDNTTELRFSRDRTAEELWGHCKSCYYAETCRGGCSWTAHTLMGKRGNMPYCHHRAEQLQQRGVREVLKKVEAAPGNPFDFGRYEVVEEPCEPS